MHLTCIPVSSEAFSFDLLYFSLYDPNGSHQKFCQCHKLAKVLRLQCKPDSYNEDIRRFRLLRCLTTKDTSPRSCCCLSVVSLWCFFFLKETFRSFILKQPCFIFLYRVFNYQLLLSLQFKIAASSWSLKCSNFSSTDFAPVLSPCRGKAEFQCFPSMIPQERLLLTLHICSCFF